MRNLYSSVLPAAIRRSSVVVSLKQRLLGHDGIYDAGYYESTVEGPAVRSAGTIADSILEEFDPKSVVDVGCGTGALLLALRERGCEVFGLEYSKAALEYCWGRGLRVQRFDLERDALDHAPTFDVAISMEVAEHLPEAIADRYIGLLTRLSHQIVFTAAQPGQGGSDHVNEQPRAYWIEKFTLRGFSLDGAITDRWRETWRASGRVESWYSDNLLVFKTSRPS